MARTPANELIPSDATRPTWDLIRVSVNESFATLRTGLWPFAKLHPMPKARPDPSRRPAVLVHGFLAHPEVWRPLMRKLLKAGWPRVERVGYPSTRVSLEDIVGRVADAVRALSAEGPVDLVGHSLGAVACRAFLKVSGGAPLVRRFVSLGGAHGGTSLYRLVPRKLRPALDPRGPWVQRLAEGPEPVPTTVIRAAYDHQVFPPKRARIEGADEIVLYGLGHNGLLWDARAHDAVLKVLLSEDPLAGDAAEDGEPVSP